MYKYNVDVQSSVIQFANTDTYILVLLKLIYTHLHTSDLSETTSIDDSGFTGTILECRIDSLGG